MDKESAAEETLRRRSEQKKKIQKYFMCVFLFIFQPIKYLYVTLVLFYASRSLYVLSTKAASRADSEMETDGKKCRDNRRWQWQKRRTKN